MKRKYLSYPAFIFMIIIGYSFTIFPPDDDNILNKILFNLRAHYEWYPQQKVHLHLDKNQYNVDETVWMKAYVVNATTHHPDSMSTNLYVDLINPSGNVVQTRLLRIEKGYANGDFSFQDTVPEGRYRIRAYTNYMRNVGDDFFFTRDIYVKNPNFTTYATRDEVKKVKKSHRKNIKKSKNLEVDFMPEGGTLLSGVENRVAFKAINELGKGIDIEAELLNRKGKPVVSFRSDFRGMGSFTFIPDKDENYKVNILSPDIKKENVEFPEVIDKGIGIKASYNEKDDIVVEMFSNIRKKDYPPNTSYYLVAHTRGKEQFSTSFDLNQQNPQVVIPTKDIPNGILHLTLFNQGMNPVSERLMFVYHEKPLKVRLVPSSSATGKREKVGLKMKVTDRDGKPVKGNFSLSVANTSNKSEENNIMSDLLLTSDLKGSVEDPAWYFNNYNEEKQEKLDYVMLTNGWKRFDWNLVMLNEKVPLAYPVENGLEIGGRITRQFFNIPLKDIKVTLTILNQFNDSYITRSGPRGYYLFDDLYYPDTVEVMVEAVKENGSRNLLITLNQKEQKKIDDLDYITLQNLRKPGPEGKYVTEEEEEPEDPFYEENNEIHRIYNEPNNVIIVDERFHHYRNVAQIIQGRVPGVLVTGDKIIIRGVNTFYGSTDPLFLVDGMPVDQGMAMSLSPYDIDRIEILKGPETAIYGSRGANGVIAIYTKRGKFMKKGVIDFKMLGYYTPKEYYSPRYDLRPDDSFEDDRSTLFWEPFVTTNEEGEAWLDFFTSDLSGEYAITLEGISNEGEIAYEENYLRVK